MRCKRFDVCAYLLALDFYLDSEIGDIRMYEHDNGMTVTIGVDETYMSVMLLDKILIKINKKRKDFDLFVDGRP